MSKDGRLSQAKSSEKRSMKINRSGQKRLLRVENIALLSILSAGFNLLYNISLHRVVYSPT